MTNEQQRQAFEQALQANRCDVVTRGVYADWLEEHGYDDEALEQRRMTSPEWVEAARWMEQQAKEGGETSPNYGEHCNGLFYDGHEVELQWRKVTYDDLIQAGYQFLETGEQFIQLGQEYLRDNFYGETLELYWRYWSTITGKPAVVTGDPAKWTYFEGKLQSPFSCAC